jgi:hypothetical protein
MVIPILSFRALLVIPTLEDVSLSEAFYNIAAPLHPVPIHMNRLKHMRFRNELLCHLLLNARAPLLEILVILNGWISPEHYTTLGHPGEPYTFPSLTFKNTSLIDVVCGDRAAMSYFAFMTCNASQITVDSEDGILHSIDDLPEKEEGFWPNLRMLIICDIDFQYPEVIAGLLTIARCWDRYKRGLTLKMPREHAMQWKELPPPQSTYEMVSALCAIEKLVANDQGPWSPNKGDTLDRRLGFGDLDFFRTSLEALPSI